VTYTIRTEPSSIEIEISAPTREGLFRDALAAVLEAACGTPTAEAKATGQVVVLQAAGTTPERTLASLLASALEAARVAEGALSAPRWLAFDEARATANLPVMLPRATVWPLVASEVVRREGTEGSPWAVTVKLTPAAGGHPKEGG
jgi:hypothetical protein